MGLLSFLKRKSDAAPEAAAAAAPDAVAAARTRARRRLIGAAVLLGIGVIGFPLLFETQPRPIPVNIPIEIPGRDGAPPLALPPATPALTPAPAAQVAQIAPVAGGEPVQAAAPAPAAADIVEKLAPPTKESIRAASPASDARPKPAAAPPPSPPAPTADSKPADDGARARALLNGQAPGPSGGEAAVRVVVQVGAYAEAAKLRDVRQKVEKLGFKTYTQVVDADGGKQTRVRVGPFDNRAEADKAAARIKAAGLPVAVYTL